MAENKVEEDLRVSDVKKLKENFEKWRKIALWAMPSGILLIILSWVLPIHIPFLWGVFLFFLGLTPVIGFYVSHSLKVVKAWEMGVVFRKGRIYREVDPGWCWLLWPLDGIRFVQMYDVKYDPSDQEVFTKETIEEEGKPIEKQMPAMADIVFWGRVIDPTASITRVENLKDSVLKLVLGILRDVISRLSFEDANKTKDRVAKAVQDDANKVLQSWGYEIDKVQIQSIKPSPDILRAQEQVQVSSKKRESAKIDAKTRAEVMAILDEADPDMRRRGLQALEGFKGNINIFGSSIEEILRNIIGTRR